MVAVFSSLMLVPMLWSLCEKGRLKLQFFMGAGGSTLQVLGKKTMQIPEPH